MLVNVISALYFVQCISMYVICIHVYVHTCMKGNNIQNAMYVFFSVSEVQIGIPCKCQPQREQQTDAIQQIHVVRVYRVLY